MKSQFSKNVRAMREQRGFTQKQLAERLGVREQTVIKWEGGGIEKPRQKAIIDRLCELYGVTEQDLFGYADGYYAKLHGLTSAPAGALSPSGASRAVPVRVLGATHAGEAMEQEEIDGIVCDVPAEVYGRHPEAFLLRVEGDCMNRRYPEGCMVLVDPRMEPANGRAVVAELPDGTSVLRSYLRGQSALMLTADSYSAHDDIVLTDATQPVRCLGVVVWYQSDKDET